MLVVPTPFAAPAAGEPGRRQRVSTRGDLLHQSVSATQGRPMPGCRRVLSVGMQVGPG